MIRYARQPITAPTCRCTPQVVLSLCLTCANRDQRHPVAGGRQPRVHVAIILARNQRQVELQSEPHHIHRRCALCDS